MEHRLGRFTDWCVVLLLMAAAIFSITDRFALSLLLEPIKQDLGVTDTQLGLLSGVSFGLFYAGMGVPMGWLADRWSRKGTIILGIAVWSVSTAASGFANSFGQLMLARIGVGAGEAGLAPVSFSIVHDRFPRHLLGRAMSLLQAGSVIGSGVSFIVCGFIYNFFSTGGGAGLPLMSGLRPWQQTFVAVSLPGALFILLIALIHTPRASDRAPVAIGTQQPAVLAALRPNVTTYILLFLGMSAVIMTHYSLLSWLPAILGREIGWTPKQVGASYGVVVAIFSPLGLLVGGTLADMLVKRGVSAAHIWVSLLAVVLAFPAVVFFPWVHGAAPTIAMAAWIHFSLGLPLGVVPAFIQLVTPSFVRGRVSAVYVFSVNFFGLGVAPAVIGAITGLSPADPHALRGAVAALITPALLLSGILLAWLVSRLRQADKNIELSPGSHIADGTGAPKRA
jgi:MFS family permease